MMHANTLTLIGSAGGGAPPAPVAAPNSLQFADANDEYTTADFSTFLATGVSNLLNVDQTLVVKAAVPWFKYAHAVGEFHMLLGNDNRSPATAGLGLWLAAARGSGGNNRIEASIGGVTVQADLGTGATPENLTIALSVSGGVLDLRVYANGASVRSAFNVLAGTNSGFSGIAPWGGGFRIGCTGTGFSGWANVYAGSNIRGFGGAMGFIGLYGGVLSNTEIEDLSKGRSPEQIGTASSWAIARAFTDADATELTAESWATGDTAGAWGNKTNTFSRGGDTAGAYASGNHFAVTGIYDGVVWGINPQTGTANVSLAFESSGLTGGVEVQLVRTDGSVFSAWQAVSGVNLGTVNSGSVELPRCTPGFMRLQARPTAAPSMVHEPNALCAAGWSFTVFGQSDVVTTLIDDAFENVFEAGGNEGNFTFAYDGYAPAMTRINQARKLRNGMHAMAMEAGNYADDTPILCLMVAQGGTSPWALMSDADGAMSWADAVEALTAVSGNRFSAHLPMWIPAWKNDTIDNILAFMEADYTGAITGPYDHYVLDPTEFHYGTDAGVCLMPELFGKGFDDPALDYDKEWDGTNYDTTPGTTFRQNNEEMRWLAANKGWEIGPEVLDSEQNGGHTDYSQGRYRIARRILIGAMRACGADAKTDPAVQSAVLSGDGTQIVVTFSLPNGGTLQTNGGPTNSPTGANANAVQGFEVQDPVDGSFFPTRSGFTAAITDAAAGEVTLTKSSGTWSAGVIVHYAPAYGLYYGQDFFDHDLHQGRLYESGTHEEGLGLAVKGQEWVQDPATVGEFGFASLMDLDDAVMIQEIDGNFGAGTPAGAGDPVGSIQNPGSKGGYWSAPSLAERGTLRERTTWPEYPANHFIGHPRRPLRYLEITTSAKYTYSGGALLPATVDWAFGALVALRDQTSDRGVVLAQSDDFSGGGSDSTHANLNLMQNVSDAGAHLDNGGVQLRYDGAVNTPQTGGSNRAAMDGEFPSIISVAAALTVVGAAANQGTGLGEMEQSRVPRQSAFQFGGKTAGTFGNGSFDLYGFWSMDKCPNTEQLQRANAWLSKKQERRAPVAYPSLLLSNVREDSAWTPQVRVDGGAQAVIWSANGNNFTDVGKTTAAGVGDNVLCTEDVFGNHDSFWASPGPVLREWPNGMRYLDYTGGPFEAIVNQSGDPNLNFSSVEAWWAGQAADTDWESILDFLHNATATNPWTSFRLRMKGQTSQINLRRDNNITREGVQGSTLAIPVDLKTPGVAHWSGGTLASQFRMRLNGQNVWWGDGSAAISVTGGRQNIHVLGQFTGYMSAIGWFDTPSNSPSYDRRETWQYFRRQVGLDGAWPT